MIIENISSIPICVIFNGIENCLNAGEKKEILCYGRVDIVLKHLYESSTMPIKEIAEDLSNNTLASLFVASYQEPYFKIVLDSEYCVQCGENTVVKIQKQRLRPTYECSYDRLALEINNGSILYEKYDFSEKEDFKSLYKKVLYQSNKGGRIFRNILLFCAVVVLPLMILATMIIGILGFIGFSMVLGLLLIPALIIELLARVTNKISFDMVVSCFENDKILKNYSEKIKEIEID